MHDHDHAHHHRHASVPAHAGARYARRLRAALALSGAFLVVQVVTGVLTGSLALLGDAGHLATDTVGLALAVTAIALAGRPAHDRRRTYGWYRLEILAAVVNAALLLAVAVWVAVEAVRRLGDPAHVDGAAVLVVGGLGLLVNLAAFALLREGSRESLNLEGAYLEVLADLVGSVAVVVGAALLVVTGWGWIDPVLGLAIGTFVVPRALALGRRGLRILIQSVPEGADPAAVRADLAGIPGVVDVHDVHLWTLTSGMDVATAHVMVADGTDSHGVLDQARAVLAERHGIAHATIQVEPDSHTGCDELTW